DQLGAYAALALTYTDQEGPLIRQTLKTYADDASLVVETTALRDLWGAALVDSFFHTTFNSPVVRLADGLGLSGIHLGPCRPRGGRYWRHLSRRRGGCGPGQPARAAAPRRLLADDRRPSAGREALRPADRLRPPGAHPGDGPTGPLAHQSAPAIPDPIWRRRRPRVTRGRRRDCGGHPGPHRAGLWPGGGGDHARGGGPAAGARGGTPGAGAG